jgi:hypothetical protein
MPDSPSLCARSARLAVAALFLWAFMRILSPQIAGCPFVRDYARVVEETGIVPGALYYTDVAQTTEGEFNNRDAIRYFVGKQHRENRP